MQLATSGIPTRSDLSSVPVTTLAQIAASFGVEASDLAAMVGMSDVGVDTPLTQQQVDFAVDAAETNPFTGPNRIGRHSRTR